MRHGKAAVEVVLGAFGGPRYLRLHSVPDTTIAGRNGGMLTDGPAGGAAKPNAKKSGKTAQAADGGLAGQCGREWLRNKLSEGETKGGPK